MKKVEENSYLNITTDQMKVGDVFFVEVENIVSVSLNTSEILDSDNVSKYPKLYPNKFRVYDANRFQRTFYKEDEFVKLDDMYRRERRFSDFSAQDIKWDSITLLQYMGNNEFFEYYSGSIIRYENSPIYIHQKEIRRGNIAIEDIKPEESYIDFYKKYNMYLKNPLYVENGTLLPLRKRYLNQFFHQGKNQLKLKKIILKMREEAISYLEEDWAYIKKQDERFVCEENAARMLVKKDS